jgi:hypothetical protein
MAVEFVLIPMGTRLTANGEGQPFEITSSTTRTFLCSMEITDQMEQESVDISVWGSADGQVLDLSLKPEIRFIRAKYDLTRWGRVAPHPMFVLGFRAIEIPAFTAQTAAR